MSKYRLVVNGVMCTPTLEQLELYPAEHLNSMLTPHDIAVEDDYDRYDLLSLALLALRIDCPRYTAEQVEEIRQGSRVPRGGTEPSIVRILIPLQRQCVDEMGRIATRHDVLFNTSDTGTGKTLMGLGFSVLQGKLVYIVTKTNIVPSWMRVIRDHGLTNVLGVTSYELAIRGKEYKVDSWMRNAEGKLVWKAVTKQSQYIRRGKTTRKPSSTAASGRGRKSTDVLGWTGLENTVVIFDEPHNSKHVVVRHQLLMGASTTSSASLLLATRCCCWERRLRTRPATSGTCTTS